MHDDHFISQLGASYVFRYTQATDGWRAFIASQPSYGTRSNDCHATHRYRTNDGRYLVCWTRPLATLRDARAVAHYWADCTDVYRVLGFFPRRRDGLAAWFARLMHSLA